MKKTITSVALFAMLFSGVAIADGLKKVERDIVRDVQAYITYSAGYYREFECAEAACDRAKNGKVRIIFENGSVETEMIESTGSKQLDYEILRAAKTGAGFSAKNVEYHTGGARKSYAMPVLVVIKDYHKCSAFRAYDAFLGCREDS